MGSELIMWKSSIYPINDKCVMEWNQYNTGAFEEGAELKPKVAY